MPSTNKLPLVDWLRISPSYFSAPKALTHDIKVTSVPPAQFSTTHFLLSRNKPKGINQ